MSRIGSFGASQMYLSRLTAIQQRVHTEQIQVSTELKSVNYTGIAADTNRLVNLENEKSRADKFVSDNNLATTRLKAADVSMTAIEKEMKNFRDMLVNYQQYSSKEEKDVKELQRFAFQTMVNIQAYLSANIDGQYIFSGGRVADEPVELPATEVSEFQEIFDGVTRTYPTTRPASLQELHTLNEETGDLTIDSTTGLITTTNPGTMPVAAGSLVTIKDAGNNVGKQFTVQAVDPTNSQFRVSKLMTSGGETGVSIAVTDKPGIATTEYTSVDFSADGDTITFNGPSFDTTQFAVGTVFRVSGSAAVTDIDGINKTNDGLYEIESISAGPPYQITVKSAKLAAEGGPVAATVHSDSWYRGDTIALKQQVDASRTIDLGVYASDPAFDKAFRAMGLIAQGKFGTAGGLENNQQRVEQAMKLIQDAISRNTAGPGPFGHELASDLETLRGNVGGSVSLINSTNEKHKAFAGFLSVRITSIASIDKTEAVTRLLDDQNALEASYKALSTVRDLSLLKYMK